MEEEYHDTEWRIPIDDDRLLFAALLLAALKTNLGPKTVLLQHPHLPLKYEF
jgi:3-methyladenine DNA glycosylase Tag